MCCDRNLLCFVTLYFSRSFLVLVHITKQIFHAIFCLMSKLFTLSNKIFNSAFVEYELPWVNIFWYETERHGISAYYFSWYYNSYMFTNCKSAILDKTFDQGRKIQWSWTGKQNFDIYFCVLFDCHCQSLIFGRKTGYWAMSPLEF